MHWATKCEELSPSNEPDNVNRGTNALSFAMELVSI